MDEQENTTQVEDQESSQVQEDPIKNIKAEFNRKLANIEESNQQLAQAMKAEVSQILDYVQSGRKDASEDLEDLKYSDPDKYVELKMQNMEQNILKKVESSTAQQQQKQQVLADLVSKYPELNDPSSDLYNEAIQASKQLDDSIRNTPHGYKLAVMEAVANLGAMPVSKRKKSEPADEFISSGGNSTSSGKSPSGKKESVITDEMLKIAQLFGRDINDKEFLKRLETAAKRKKWNKYQ